MGAHGDDDDDADYDDDVDDDDDGGGGGCLYSVYVMKVLMGFHGYSPCKIATKYRNLK